MLIIELIVENSFVVRFGTILITNSIIAHENKTNILSLKIFNRYASPLFYYLMFWKFFKIKKFQK